MNGAPDATSVQMSLFEVDAFTHPAGGRATGDRCPRCANRPGHCERCRRRLAQRRARRAIRLRQQGATVREVALRLGVDAATIRRYLADREAAGAVVPKRRRTIANAPIRTAVLHALEADHELSYTTIARRAGLADGRYLARLLGIAKTGPAIKNGKRYPGTIRTEIDVEHAGRIVRAIGRAPVEFDGL